MRITITQHTYIMESVELSSMVIAKKLSLSYTTVHNHRNGLVSIDKKKPKPRKKYADRDIKVLTDFGTNGIFDVDKWAKCLHV